LTGSTAGGASATTKLLLSLIAKDSLVFSPLVHAAKIMTAVKAAQFRMDLTLLSSAG
jgi:hypothetical protein